MGQAGERLGPSGALFARARCSSLDRGARFGHIFAHILHAGWRAGHHGVNFRNSDLVEPRVHSHSQWQYLTGFGRWICPLSPPGSELPAGGRVSLGWVLGVSGPVIGWNPGV